jgi:lipid A disaccharide synthetase
MIVAGEASGDIYGARLVLALKELAPDITFFGLGGPEMENAGVRIDGDHTQNQAHLSGLERFEEVLKR